MKPEIIKLEYDTILEFWNELYFKDSSTELNGETFTHIEKINTSEFSDGESFDYIVQRKSDGKYFKYHWWEGGNSGYIFSDEKNTLEEVFPEVINKTIWHTKKSK